MAEFSTEVNIKIDNAVNRLNKILPLKKNQLSLSSSIARLYHDILFSYVDIGRSLNKKEIAERVENLNEVINVLKDKDLVVFDDSNNPVGAYPFTMESRNYKLSVNGHQLHCMCALDSLAVSPMFNKMVEITSKCHVSEQAIFIKQSGFNVLNVDDVSDVSFAINWGAESGTTCCANSLCAEMIFLKGKNVVSEWLDADELNREIFELPEAIEFAARFFMPLVE